MDINDIFIEKVCRNYLCGSQRCDCSQEWLNGCGLYNEFVNRYSGLRNKNDIIEIDYIIKQILKKYK